MKRVRSESIARSESDGTLVIESGAAMRRGLPEPKAGMRRQSAKQMTNREQYCFKGSLRYESRSGLKRGAVKDVTACAESRREAFTASLSVSNNPKTEEPLPLS